MIWIAAPEFGLVFWSPVMSMQMPRIVPVTAEALIIVMPVFFVTKPQGQFSGPEPVG